MAQSVLGWVLSMELLGMAVGSVLLGGAALAPVIGGYLFEAGLGLQTVAVIMGAGSILAALALPALRVREGD